MTNYIIITPARCGSSWLSSGLEKMYKLNYLDYTNNTVRLKTSTDNLDALDNEEKIVYFKKQLPFLIKLYVDDMPKSCITYGCTDTQFIWIYRKNLAEHFLSFYFAQKSGVWARIASEQMQAHAFNYNTQDIEFAPTEKDKNFYINIFNKQKEVYAQYKTLFQTHPNVEIAYEDLFKNNPWGITEDIATELTGQKKLNTYTVNQIEWAKNFIDRISE